MALHFAASAAEQEEEEEEGAERERRLIGFRQRRVSRFGGREATSERVSECTVIAFQKRCCDGVKSSRRAPRAPFLRK